MHTVINNKDEKHMLNLFEDARNGDSKYDAMVCFSGGKDSTYLLWVLKNVYNLNVLAFTVTHPFMRPLAIENTKAIPEKLGIDHLEFDVDEKIFHTFVKKGLEIWKEFELTEMTGCQLCGYFHKVIPKNMAHEMGIPLLIHGEDPTQVEGIQYPKNPVMFSDLFDAVFGQLTKGTVYDGNNSHTVKEINFFCIEGYDHRKIQSQLDDQDLLTYSESEPQDTNCLIFHYFAKKAYHYNHLFPYMNMINWGLFHRKATVLDQILGTKENLNHDESVEVLKQYAAGTGSRISTKLENDIKLGIKMGEDLYEAKN